jgi:hypothetical protein
MTPGCALSTPVGSVTVSRYRLAEVKQSTANVMRITVIDVSAVRNFRFRMFATPSRIALIITDALAKLAPTLVPRPERMRLSSVSNRL